MKKYNLLIVLVAVSMLWSFGNPRVASTAEEVTADIYLNSGLQKYFEGDFNAAIADLEIAYKLDKENEKIKSALIQVLLEKGNQFYLQKDNDAALPYINRAHSLDPNNVNVKEMYILVQQDVMSPDMFTAAGPEGVTGLAGAKMTKDMSSWFKMLQKQQEKLLSGYLLPQQTLKALIEQSDAERKEISSRLKEEREQFFGLLEKKDASVVDAIRDQQDVAKTLYKDQNKVMRGAILFGVIGLVVAVSVVTFFLYMVIHFATVKRETMFMQQQERILGVMQRMQDTNVTLTQRAVPMLSTPAEGIAEGAEGIPAEELAEPEQSIQPGSSAFKGELSKPFSFINENSVEQLLYVFKKEPVERISLIVSFLDPKIATQVMASLPSELQVEVATQIAQFKEVEIEEVKEIAEYIKKKIESTVDGKNRLVNILDQLEENKREEILASLTESDPELAQEVRKEMFTFEDIVFLDNKTLQRVIREINQKEIPLATVLKNDSQGVTAKIMENLSEGAREMLNQEIDLGEAVPPKKIEEEKKRIVSLIRGLERSGEIEIVK